MLTQWIKETEAQMRDMVKTISDWVETAEILSSMPGIGG
jgi:ribosomal protein L30/L7E